MTAIAGLVVIELAHHRDERGALIETYEDDRYAALGILGPFVQDNVTWSHRGVVRGLHFQRTLPQGKLVSVIAGAIYDVAVDVRPGSATLGQWFALELSYDNRQQLWIPPGFAHGFQALTDRAVVSYKLTARYAPDDEAAIRYSDPTLAIPWPIGSALTSPRDANAPLWSAGGAR
jgi:dTDP-4-dehydrorhamnose 3,5-epimerase